jgi:hypothetical protein
MCLKVICIEIFLIKQISNLKIGSFNFIIIFF